MNLVRCIRLTQSSQRSVGRRCVNRLRPLNSPVDRLRRLRGVSREFQVGHVWRRDLLDEGEAVQLGDVVEQTLAASEQHRHHVKLHLVDRAGVQELLRGARTARKRNILSAGRAPRLVERTLDPVGYEGETRAPLHYQGVARMMRQYEHGMMERWIASPPSIPWICPAPRAGAAAEHVTPHDGRPDIRELLLHHRRALVHLPALHAMRAPPGLQREYPFVQCLPADTQRLLHALIRAGYEAVQRHGDAESEL